MHKGTPDIIIVCSFRIHTDEAFMALAWFMTTWITEGKNERSRDVRLANTEATDPTVGAAPAQHKENCGGVGTAKPWPLLDCEVLSKCALLTWPSSVRTPKPQTHVTLAKPLPMSVFMDNWPECANSSWIFTAWNCSYTKTPYLN